jgi:hypothetical protein
MLNQTQYYSLRKNTFGSDYLKILEREIVASTYLADNQLSKNFTGTQGFSIIFHNSEIDKVIQEFRFFEPYIKTALSSKYNAFYLNPLVLQAGGSVKPHVDCSLSGYCQTTVIPKAVSVLYVKVPSDLQGGELVLTSLPRKGAEVGRIAPQANTLLYFLGSLNHSVNKVTTSETRISLVCEQYNLSEIQLQKVPKFQIKSAAY